jgi:hypothetical protein
MPLTDTHVARFVEIASGALQVEDERLFNRMGGVAGHGLYADRHPPGLHWTLPEMGVVFLIFRAVLEDGQLPFELGWEVPYPRGGKMDLGLFERSHNIIDTVRMVGAIEAKWWGQAEPVLGDIRKLRQLQDGIRKLVLLLGTWPGERFDQMRENAQQHIGLVLREDWTRFFKVRREPRGKGDFSHFYVAVAEVPEGSVQRA